MVWDSGPDTVMAGADAGPETARNLPREPSRGPNGHAHAGDQTRAKILEVALELIADRGYAATSTREIAERLGFTKAALYYHFRTKDDLLAAMVRPVRDELEALIAAGEPTDGPEARVSLVVGYVTLVGRHAHLIRVLAIDPSVKESAGLHSAIRLFRRLVPLLVGEATPDTAQRARARAALTAVHGALVHAQPDEDPDVLRRTAIEVACAALGLTAPEADGTKETNAGGMDGSEMGGTSDTMTAASVRAR
ncbi:MAG TPA: helix-turn-helix domain-containing protein [Acidimicrobiales bacterium]|nr:helix-turn-helix domain-containing protein [Acidimicrobiales bacterium]